MRVDKICTECHKKYTAPFLYGGLNSPNGICPSCRILRDKPSSTTIVITDYMVKNATYSDDPESGLYVVYDIVFCALSTIQVKHDIDGSLRIIDPKMFTGCNPRASRYHFLHQIEIDDQRTIDKKEPSTDE